MQSVNQTEHSVKYTAGCLPKEHALGLILKGLHLENVYHAAPGGHY